MANYSDPQGYLQAYFDSLGRQTEQLRAPQAPQGGILANADPVMLSLAAGLLAPTKAGSFGESIGAGLSAAQGPLQEIRKQEAARADKIAALEQARAKMALDLYDIQMGGRGRSYKPDEPNLVFNRYLNNLSELQAQKDLAEEGSEEEKYWQNQIDEYKKSNPRLSAKQNENKPEKEKKEAPEPGSIPRLENPEEADNLPSGTLFYDPEGVLRKVP